MKKINLLLVFLAYLNHGFSQTIHSPDEILKIMMDSKFSYEIKNLDKTIECKNYSDRLNHHDYYRVVSDSGLFTKEISINEKAKPLFDKAEYYFQKNKLDSAIAFYQLSLSADSSIYTVMTYIGQVFEKIGDNNNAILWYKKAISKNYIDYMAHWFLADAYLNANNLKDAVDEIVIAQILNRNNPRIKKSLTNIFEKAKRNTDDWCFNPQIELIKLSDTKASVAFNEKWTGYGMAKALWTFEPGYKESMGVTNGYSTLEDKECLIALLIALENAKISINDEPQLKILKDAAENKYLQEYIIYEIVLPQSPFVAYQLPEQTILEIKNYILNIRNTMK